LLREKEGCGRLGLLGVNRGYDLRQFHGRWLESTCEL
jgi:hypothetical protein